MALVSGVGPGIGRSIVMALARHGADMVLAARRQHVLEEVAAEVEQLGRRVVWLPTDITKPVECQRLVNHALIELGHLDVLVNNAHRGGTDHPLATSDLDGPWRAAMETNFFGSLTMTQAALAALVDAGDGRIVNINTMAVRDVQPGQGPYAASKAALAMATRTLAVELGGHGIRVNSVHPGYTLGPAVAAWSERVATDRGVSAAEVLAEVADQAALRYLPDADEVAGTVVYLASDLARPVTGQSIDVNAGAWL